MSALDWIVILASLAAIAWVNWWFFVARRPAATAVAGAGGAQEVTITVQAGGYGEHHFTTVTVGDRTISVDAPYFNVRLAPGAGDTLVVGLRRYVHQPTLAFPWDRSWMIER